MRHRHGPHARVGRYAWIDHYAPLRAGLRDGRAVDPARRPPCRRVRRRQLDGRPGGRAPCRARLVRQERQPAPPRCRQLVRARIDRHDGATTNRPTSVVADGCGTCTRCLDGCPTGAIIAPGVIDGRRCLSWILQKPGTDPGRVARPRSATGSTGATTARTSVRSRSGSAAETRSHVDDLSRRVGRRRCALLDADDEWIDAAVRTLVRGRS